MPRGLVPSKRMTSFHQILANSLLLLMLLLGLWGLGVAVFNRKIGGSYRSTFILAMGVFILQDVIGLALFISGSRPKDILHVIYGVAPVLALGLAHTYAGSMTSRREALTYGGAALFTFGLVIRAYTTGR